MPHLQTTHIDQMRTILTHMSAVEDAITFTPAHPEKSLSLVTLRADMRAAKDAYEANARMLATTDTLLTRLALQF